MGEEAAAAIMIQVGATDLEEAAEEAAAAIQVWAAEETYSSIHSGVGSRGDIQ